jgi:hypothetical protein
MNHTVSPNWNLWLFTILVLAVLVGATVYVARRWRRARK